MSKIFGGCFGAFKGTHHSYNATTVFCPSEQEAKNHFVELSKIFYPIQQGYSQHYSAVAEVTQSQIVDYLEQEKQASN